MTVCAEIGCRAPADYGAIPAIGGVPLAIVWCTAGHHQAVQWLDIGLIARLRRRREGRQ